MLTYSDDAQCRRQTAGGQAEHERVRDQSYIKQYNLQTVMAILKKHQPISRTDISKMTGMSPTSVTRIVGALLNHGLIHESSVCGADSQSNVRRGRKAIYLRVQDDGLYAIGIRLDKSVVQLCVTDFGDRILYRAESVVDGECTPEKMAQAAKVLFDRIPEGTISNMDRIGGAGICLSGSVNKWTGEVKASRRMGWENVNIREIFEKTFSMPVWVEDEVKACLIGEKVRMDIRDEVDTAYLYLGEEPSVAIVSNGMIVRGRHNEAGNISNIPIRNAKAAQSDPLKLYLTEEGLLQQAQQKDLSVNTLDALLHAYQRQEKWAEELLGNFRYHLHKTILMICGLVDPQQIILGGEMLQKMQSCFDLSQMDERICFGGSHSEGCVSGAARIALRQAAVERIGQNAE